MPKSSFSHPASILKNTSKVVSSSQDDWSGVRANSYFRIGSDELFYTVKSTKSIYYIRDFQVIHDYKIKTNEDVGLNITSEDFLTISYKEYELATVIEIENYGKGYKVGELIKLNGGNKSVDSVTGLLCDTVFKVTAIKENGAIKDIELVNRGKYVNTPKTINDVDGEGGSGAIFVVEFQPLSERKIMEVDVKNVIKVKDENVTFIELDFALPSTLKQGKFSVRKWEMELNQNYVGEDKINQPYFISYDFTGNYNLPLLVKNSFSTELIVNQTFRLLDEIIKKQDNRIKKLEERVAILENPFKELFDLKK